LIEKNEGDAQEFIFPPDNRRLQPQSTNRKSYTSKSVSHSERPVGVKPQKPHNFLKFGGLILGASDTPGEHSFVGVKSGDQ